MSCFMCSSKGCLSPATFLLNNIPAASTLLRRNITFEEVENALACPECQRTFSEYVDLQSRLSSLVNNFSERSRPEEVVLIPPDPSFQLLTEHKPDETGPSFVLEGVDIAADYIQGVENSPLDSSAIVHEEDVLVEDHVDITEGELGLTDVSGEGPAKSCTLLGSAFKCTLCGFSTSDSSKVQNALEIVNHLKLSHNVRVLICHLCGQGFNNSSEFTKHQKIHTTADAKELSCYLCSEKFANSRLLDVHMRLGHADFQPATNDPLKKCSNCYRNFKSEAKLKEHMHQHLGTRPYTCGVCAVTFSSKYILKSHQKTHERDRPRTFKCSRCDKCFYTNTNRLKHEWTHETVKDFKCKECDKAFVTARNLQQHELIHRGLKRWNCKFCQKAFLRRVECDDHERGVHTGQRPFSCDVCDATFSQKSNLRSHKKALHLNVAGFQCELCPKTFKRRRLLDCHVMAIHMNERSFRCQFCTSSYTYPEHLQKHVARVHQPLKERHCEVCRKVFQSTESLRMHRYVHSAKKMYECVGCEAGFMRKSSLLRHVQQMNHRTLSGSIRINHLKPELASSSRSQKEVRLVVESKLSKLPSLANGMVANWDVAIDDIQEEVIDGIDLEEDSQSSSVEVGSAAVLEDWEKGGDAILGGYNSFLQLVGDEELVDVETEGERVSAGFSGGLDESTGSSSSRCGVVKKKSRRK